MINKKKQNQINKIQFKILHMILMLLTHNKLIYNKLSKQHQHLKILQMKLKHNQIKIQQILLITLVQKIQIIQIRQIRIQIQARTQILIPIMVIQIQILIIVMLILIARQIVLQIIPQVIQQKKTMPLVNKKIKNWQLNIDKKRKVVDNNCD